MRARFRRWRHSLIAVPRWVFTASYFGFILLGTVVSIVGSRVFDFTTWEDYQNLWGLLVSVAALVAMVGSFGQPLSRLEKVERFGASGLMSLFTAYLGGAIIQAVQHGGPGGFTLAGAVIAVFLFLLPTVRALDLLRTAGRSA